MRKLKLAVRIIAFFGLIVSGMGFVFLAKTTDELSLSRYDVVSDKYQGDKDYRIVQLSDLHNHSLVYANGMNLKDKIISLQPDAIVCTGDFVDDHTQSYSVFTGLVESWAEKAIPSFYVDGNHERHAPTAITSRLHAIFAEGGCYDLNRGRMDLPNGITLSGIEDPGENRRDLSFSLRSVGDVPEQLTDLGDPDSSRLNIMLCHRPDLFDLIAKKDYDLTLSGHTHGGQIVIGDWAVASSPWAKYRSGSYYQNRRELIVSKGLGYSYYLPVRYDCPCEIVLITIKSKA